MHDELLRTAVEAATSAGALLLERFGAVAAGVATKSTATDPVSDADRDAEALILDVLSEARPSDGVLAEEGGASESASGLRWVVDPLDGTVNYLFGIPHWAVSIAVEDSSGPVVGVVHDAPRGETFTAVRGHGARLGHEPIHVRPQTELRLSLVATGFGYEPAARIEQAQVLGRLIGHVRDIRRAGTASLDLAWTACGRLDGFYEAGLKPWDLAAGALLVREAGGTVAPLPVPISSHAGIVASTPGIHSALVGVLAEAANG